MLGIVEQDEEGEKRFQPNDAVLGFISLFSL